MPGIPGGEFLVRWNPCRSIDPRARVRVNKPTFTLLASNASLVGEGSA